MTAEGWVAEYRVPFSQMRFTAAPGPGQVWGFAFRRTIQRLNETGDWTARPRGEQGIVSRWGHVVFEGDLDPPRRIEWLPYVRAGASSVRSQRHRFQRRRRPRSARRDRIGRHAVGDRQPRLRAGRAGPGRPQPLRVRDVLPRKAQLLPRGQPHVRAAVRPVPAVSLAPHRTAPDSIRAGGGRCRGRSPGGDDDRRRGEAHRQAIRLDLRRADRADVG